jgi:hypothetical protein
MIIRSRHAVAILLIANPLFAWVVVLQQQPAALLSHQAKRGRLLHLKLKTTTTSADIEQPSLEETPAATTSSSSSSTTRKTTSSTIRSKINEIDYCIDPADVSLHPVRNSMTYALNDASNRVVRRILLARSWPSLEALNQSLMQQQQKKQQQLNGNDKNNKNKDETAATTTKSSSSSKKKSPRSDTEYVADQLQAFRDKYGAVENFPYACEYLECILALATRGVEPADQAANVLYRDKVYYEAYRRVLSVLKTVGVTFLVMKTATTTLPGSSSTSSSNESSSSSSTGKQRILAPKLKDLDICLSVMDKLRLQRQQQQQPQQRAVVLLPKPDDNEEQQIEAALPPAKEKKKESFLKRLFGGKRNNTGNAATIPNGILLSRNDPSVTIQLNTVSNIVLRALLFGGDEELLIIMGTLESDRAGFIQYWWPDLSDAVTGTTTTTNRPALDYLDALIALLRSCYNDRIITSLEPKVKLSNSYGTAYERLVATAVELGSGYFRSETLFASSTDTTTTNNNNNESNNNIESLPKPRSAQEELGRFAQWESQFRQGGVVHHGYGTTATQRPGRHLASQGLGGRPDHRGDQCNVRREWTGASGRAVGRTTMAAGPGPDPFGHVSVPSHDPRR